MLRKRVVQHPTMHNPINKLEIRFSKGRRGPRACRTEKKNQEKVFKGQAGKRIRGVGKNE